MNRRDIIIISLLINAGLLTLLFMLAINSEDDTIVAAPEISKVIVDRRVIGSQQGPSLSKISPNSRVNDEVDQFLKDLASEETQTFVIDEEGYIEIPPASSVNVKPVIENVPQQNFQVDYVEVTVKRGDALEKIARSNGTTVEAIKKANQLSSHKLTIGQVLKVPIEKKNEAIKSKPLNPVLVQKQAEPLESREVSALEAQYYIVKSGDNPWKIAKQFNVKFEDLLKLNHLDEEKARNLKIGDKVRVK